MSIPPLRHRYGTQKTPVILPKVQVAVTPKHAYTLDPYKSEWADYTAVHASCGNLSGNKLTHNLSEYIRPQSSQLDEPLWTAPDLKSGISVCELISTSKKKKPKSTAGN